MRKVNNPCNRGYKHHCFLPGSNNTSPSLMFLSLKLDIKGLNPQSSIKLPLGVATNTWPKQNTAIENMQEFTQEHKYKREPNILVITI